MANIRIPVSSDAIEITKGTGKKITLTTKDKYVPEDIDIHVKPQSGSFANSASNGVDYTTDTSGNTIISTENGFLYLNEGWFNNTKISLGQLIPDIATMEATTEEIRYGYKAYGDDGSVLTGVMLDQTPKFDGGELTVTPTVESLTAPTVNVTISGKFAPETDGSNTIVSGGLGQNYGVTTTIISGTEGTDYLSIDAGRSVTPGSVKAKVTYSRAAVLYNGAVNGYVNVANDTVALPAINSTSETTTSSTAITPAGSDKFPKLYIPIVKEISFDTASARVIQGTSSAEATITTTEVTSETNFTYPSNTSGSTYGITELVGTNTAPANSVKFNSKAGGNASASGTAWIAYTRNAVNLAGNAKGVINISDGTELLEETDSSFSTTISGSGTVNTTGATFYIPVVTPAGKGGTVTRTSSSDNVSGKKPNVTISSSASTSAIDTYGFVTATPSGSENTTFVKVTTTGTIGDEQTWSGIATIKTTRAAVTYNNTYKGLISKGTSDTFLGQSTDAGDVTHNISVDVSSTINSGTSNYASNYYVPIAEPSVTGGLVQMSNEIGMSGETVLTVGTKVAFNKGESSTDNSWSGSVDESTYGITTTAPSSGMDNYVRILPGQNGTNQTTTIEASITAEVSDIILNKNAGVSRAYDNYIVNEGETLTSSGSIGVIAKAEPGTPYYIPIVTVSGTLTPKNVITNPTYSSNSSAAFHTAIDNSTNVPGFLTSAPSDGNYITITPSTSYNNGSVTSSVSNVTISKGLTSGGTLTGGSDTDTIPATNNGATAKYIAVYGGGYDVADL